MKFHVNPNTQFPNNGLSFVTQAIYRNFHYSINKENQCLSSAYTNYKRLIYLQILTFEEVMIAVNSGE